MDDLKSLALKAADKLVSVKALVLGVTFVFLWCGKIDQATHIQSLMIILGARTANELVAMIKK